MESQILFRSEIQLIPSCAVDSSKVKVHQPDIRVPSLPWVLVPLTSNEYAPLAIQQWQPQRAAQLASALTAAG
jgi:hypothetical protein